jgi:hypothetical protein
MLELVEVFRAINTRHTLTVERIRLLSRRLIESVVKCVDAVTGTTLGAASPPAADMASNIYSICHSICHSTANSFDPEITLQVRPNFCHLAFVPHASD